jgi:phosphopantetheine adenylyltransferase
MQTISFHSWYGRIRPRGLTIYIVTSFFSQFRRLYIDYIGLCAQALVAKYHNKNIEDFENIYEKFHRFIELFNSKI